MSQLPTSVLHVDENADKLALTLAAHGVITEHSSALMSANRRSQNRPHMQARDSENAAATVDVQPRTDRQSPKQEPTRNLNRRRHAACFGIGALTILLASWFGWCGIAAWRSEPTVSSLQPSVSYQTKNIEDLVAGDTVIAMNPETGEVGEKKILQTFERVADHLQIVTFEYCDGSSQVIETTDEHPFWLRFEKKWTRAADLKQGDTVTGPNDEIQTVTDNFREEHPDGITVYNFEVEDWHTYFVFANGSRAPPVLVHNADNYTKDQIAKRMGRVSEGKGWRHATEELGHIGVKSPYSKNTNTPGSDYITYDPKLKRVSIWDAKYRKNRQYPSSPTAKQKSSWKKEARDYIKNEFDGDPSLRADLLDAVNQNHVDFRIWGWPM